MSDELQQFESWLSPLIAGLSASERLKLSRNIGQQLRRSQSKRIAAQKNPDGSPFVARKNQPTSRQRRGSIRRSMFTKLKAARYMRIQATSDDVSLGFTGRVARIARVHQLGLRDRVQPDGPQYQYPARQLLGFDKDDQALIRDAVIAHLEKR